MRPIFNWTSPVVALKLGLSNTGIPLTPKAAELALKFRPGKAVFRLKRAIDAYAQTVDRELRECVEAGRELGAKIALPIWENVWKTSLLEEMRRVCAVSEWTRPEQAMKKSAYGPLSFDHVLTSRVGNALEDCEHQGVPQRHTERRMKLSS